MHGLRAKLAVLIVSYGNPADVDRCLKSLARSTWPDFEIFVCENGGQERFLCLKALLTAADGALEQADRSNTTGSPEGRLAIVEEFKLRFSGVRVLLGAAKENLGYA